jgi:hypothetical protein
MVILSVLSFVMFYLLMGQLRDFLFPRTRSVESEQQVYYHVEAPPSPSVIQTTAQVVSYGSTYGSIDSRNLQQHNPQNEK